MRALHDVLKDVLESLILLVVILLGLTWAWHHVQPLLPLLVGGVVVCGFFKWQRHR